MPSAVNMIPTRANVMLREVHVINIFLQRTIRPQVVTTFELPGCRDMWTVVGPEKKKLKDEQDDDDDVIITDGDVSKLTLT